MSNIARTYDQYHVTILTRESLSDIMDWREYTGGMVLIPDGWTDANLGFKVAETRDGTFYPLKDENGAIVQISGIDTTNAGWYVFPTDVVYNFYTKLWSQSGGSDETQAGDKDLVVLMKG